MIPEPDRQDRLMAGLCHIAVLLPFSGAIVPMVAWLGRQGTPSWLKNQALQALAYQALGAAAFVMYYALSMIAGLAMMPVALGITALAENEQTAQPGIRVLLFILFMVLMAALVLVSIAAQYIVLPAYILLGVWGGARTLQGREFQYPLLGRILGRGKPGG